MVAFWICWTRKIYVCNHTINLNNCTEMKTVQYVYEKCPSRQCSIVSALGFPMGKSGPIRPGVGRVCPRVCREEGCKDPINVCLQWNVIATNWGTTQQSYLKRWRKYLGIVWLSPEIPVLLFPSMEVLMLPRSPGRTRGSATPSLWGPGDSFPWAALKIAAWEEIFHFNSQN